MILNFGHDPTIIRRPLSKQRKEQEKNLIE